MICYTILFLYVYRSFTTSPVRTLFLIPTSSRPHHETALEKLSALSNLKVQCYNHVFRSQWCHYPFVYWRLTNTPFDVCILSLLWHRSHHFLRINARSGSNLLLTSFKHNLVEANVKWVSQKDCQFVPPEVSRGLAVGEKVQLPYSNTLNWRVNLMHQFLWARFELRLFCTCSTALLFVLCTTTIVA